MAFNEYVYPDAQSFGNFYGSEVYTSYLGDSTNTKRMLQLKTVKEFNCSNLDPQVHTSAANGLSFEVCQFANGVKLLLKVFCTTHQQYGDIVDVACRFSRNGTEYNTVPNSGNGFIGQPGTWSSADHKALSVVRTYGIKVIWSTEYWYHTVIEGVTHPDAICLYAFIPLISNDHPDAIQSWAGIYTDRLTKVQYENESAATDSNFYNYPGVGVPSYVCSFYSIDDLVAPLNAISPITRDQIIQKTDPADPPQDNDPSGPGGGDGTYDPTSDPIDFPALPTGGALSSGAIKAFLVTNGIMSSVFNKLWNTNVFDIANWQKLLEAPLDSLIELSCIPALPTTGSNANIQFGNFDTEVQAPVITSQYITIDCGSKKINKFWGSALDFEPYTKVSIYLPFIGVKELHSDDVVGATVHVKYNIDILNGCLTAQIKCGQSVLYKYEGNCKATVPVTSRVMDALRPFLLGNAAIALSSTPAGLAAATITAAVNVAMSKTHVARSGNLSGAVGQLDDFVPYIIIHRPVQSLAKNFKKQKGYPSNLSGVLSSFPGYTEVEYVHLTGISGATDTELQEIEDLLKRGVII